MHWLAGLCHPHTVIREGTDASQSPSDAEGDDGGLREVG